MRGQHTFLYRWCRSEEKQNITAVQGREGILRGAMQECTPYIWVVREGKTLTPYLALSGIRKVFLKMCASYLTY